MAGEDLPSPAQERAIYEQHQNDPSDPGYRAFLNRLVEPLAERLSPGMRGLDFGAGPGPALALMLGERGFPTLSWDPMFEPHEALLDSRYDFVTCSETVEHFHRPGIEFERLAALLRPGGWLAIMTQWRLPGAAFDRWGYVRDPTHACFFSERTFGWLAVRHGLRLETPARHIALLQRGDA
ncbi:class I SAM-dependent methyltransferase [Lysobacter alkalisoli]|uniref:Class I SAM-dependent methyltransferase n=2 Tax=Marilutibacter alkalisoli TaxID=2591633 RepID=A0A514BXA2_9GAMM|nr:class I SAM-dependent methyltransferase [Lysobacter alkalisoli]